MKDLFEAACRQGPAEVDPPEVDVDMDLHDAVEKEAAAQLGPRRHHLRNPAEFSHNSPESEHF